MKRTSIFVAAFSCIGLAFAATAQDAGDRQFQTQDQQYDQWYDQNQDMQQQGQRTQRDFQTRQQRFGQQDYGQTDMYGEAQAGRQGYGQDQQQFRQPRQQFGQRDAQWRQQQQFRQPQWQTQQDHWDQQQDQFGQQMDQWGQQQPQWQQQSGQQTTGQRSVALSGRITQADVNIGGNMQSDKLVRLQTSRGQTVIANLGSPDQLQDLNLQRGQNLYVRGRLTQQGGQRIVMAEEVGRVTQRTTISRTGQDQAQQAGFGQQQDWQEQQRQQQEQQRQQQFRQQQRSQQFEDQNGFRGEFEFDQE